MAVVTNNALSRSLGSLEARMDSTETRLARMEKKIDDLVEVVAESKGGLRVLLTVSGAVAAATAGITSLIHWLTASH
jgi:hypothetical protein